MNDTLVQVTGAVALSALVVREVFAYLKSRKEPHGDSSNLVLRELQTMNGNHLSHIQSAIESGNKMMADAFIAHAQNEHSDSMLIVQSLGKIEGLLKK